MPLWELFLKKSLKKKIHNLLWKHIIFRIIKFKVFEVFLIIFYRIFWVIIKNICIIDKNIVTKNEDRHYEETEQGHKFTWKDEKKKTTDRGEENPYVKDWYKMGKLRAATTKT